MGEIFFPAKSSQHVRIEYHEKKNSNLRPEDGSQARHGTLSDAPVVVPATARSGRRGVVFQV